MLLHWRSTPLSATTKTQRSPGSFAFTVSPESVEGPRCSMFLSPDCKTVSGGAPCLPGRRLLLQPSLWHVWQKSPRTFPSTVFDLGTIRFGCLNPCRVPSPCSYVDPVHFSRVTTEFSTQFLRVEIIALIVILVLVFILAVAVVLAVAVALTLTVALSLEIAMTVTLLFILVAQQLCPFFIGADVWCRMWLHKDGYDGYGNHDISRCLAWDDVRPCFENVGFQLLVCFGRFGNEDLEQVILWSTPAKMVDLTLCFLIRVCSTRARQRQTWEQRAKGFLHLPPFFGKLLLVLDSRNDGSLLLCGPVAFRCAHSIEKPKPSHCHEEIVLLLNCAVAVLKCDRVANPLNLGCVHCRKVLAVLAGDCGEHLGEDLLGSSHYSFPLARWVVGSEVPNCHGGLSRTSLDTTLPTEWHKGFCKRSNGKTGTLLTATSFNILFAKQGNWFLISPCVSRNSARDALDRYCSARSPARRNSSIATC
mmetsp:Transcript_38028/g.82375  ORF Transcript_38028/g.82375 Transcript_38028/m.82375 type:complete len:476 (-) Transcript_38028:119-1546(-)